MESVTQRNPLQWSRDTLGLVAYGVCFGFLFAVFPVLATGSELAVWAVIGTALALEAALGALYLRRRRLASGAPESDREPLRLVIEYGSRPVWPMAAFALYLFSWMAIPAAIGGNVAQAVVLAVIGGSLTLGLVLAGRNRVRRVTIAPEGVSEETFRGETTTLRWDEIAEIKRGPYTVKVIGSDGMTNVAARAEGRTNDRAFAAVRAGAPQARVRDRPWF